MLWFWQSFPISRDPPEGGTSQKSSVNKSGQRKFPISRDPPEGGTGGCYGYHDHNSCFQFLGIPPKGELDGDGYIHWIQTNPQFPISRDPPEGGTAINENNEIVWIQAFPISRDPPEGGTPMPSLSPTQIGWGFQFLGIPPKGELHDSR